MASDVSESGEGRALDWVADPQRLGGDWGIDGGEGRESLGFESRGDD